MNVEDPQVLKDLVDQAARNFGGILHAELDLALIRLEAMVARAEALVARLDGAEIIGMAGFQLGRVPSIPTPAGPGAAT